MCPDCDPNDLRDQVPQRSIYLDGYWIGRTEITNRQFSQFVAETGYVTTAEQKRQSYVMSPGNEEFAYIDGADWQHPGGSSFNIIGGEDHPVTQISWDDAAEYCRWAGGRLPTEAEWEKAARGEAGFIFPWGDNEPSQQLLNYDYQSDGPLPVGSYLPGASPYGLLDMSGNLWEWVSDFYSEDYYQTSPDRNPIGPASGEGHPIRGGSWASLHDKHLNLVTTTFRLWNKPSIRSNVIGFRCAADAAQTPSAPKPQTANVVTAKPTMKDVLNIRSVWGPAGFIELSAPGTQSYAIQISPNDEWVWDFVWCATSKKRLDEILSPLALSFRIDQEHLPGDNFYEYEGEARTLKGGSVIIG